MRGVWSFKFLVHESPARFRSNARLDCLDGGSLTRDDAEAQIECDLTHLLSCCSNGFSVKGGRGSNGGFELKL